MQVGDYETDLKPFRIVPATHPAYTGRIYATAKFRKGNSSGAAVAIPVRTQMLRIRVWECSAWTVGSKHRVRVQVCVEGSTVPGQPEEALCHTPTQLMMWW